MHYVDDESGRALLASFGICFGQRQDKMITTKCCLNVCRSNEKKHIM